MSARVSLQCARQALCRAPATTRPSVSAVAAAAASLRAQPSAPSAQRLPRAAAAPSAAAAAAAAQRSLGSKSAGDRAPELFRQSEEAAQSKEEAKARWEEFQRLPQSERERVATEGEPEPIEEVGPVMTGPRAKAWLLQEPQTLYRNSDVHQAFVELVGKGVEERTLIFDGGSGPMHLAIESHLESDKTTQVVSYDVNRGSLETGLRITNQVGLREKIGALVASVASLRSVVDRVGEEERPRMFLFKDVLAVLDVGSIDKLFQDLSIVLRPGEQAILNVPLTEGSAFTRWTEFPEQIDNCTQKDLPKGIGVQFGELPSRNFFHADGLVRVLESHGLRVAKEVAKEDVVRIIDRSGQELEKLKEHHLLLCITKA